MCAPFSATERFISNTTGTSTPSPQPTAKRHRNKRVPMLAADANSRALARLAAAQQPDRRSAAGTLPPRLLEEGNYSLVERIERLAKPQGVKLVTAFLQRLRHGRPDAASLVAQQTQQANGRST